MHTRPRIPGRPRPRRRSRGQSVVEFALVLPALLTVTLGVVDGARVFSAWIALTNASREAAVYAGGSIGYLNWCRNPLDATQKAPQPAVSVPCPTGAGSSNYRADPDNIAYRIAAEAAGLDTAAIVVDRPSCDGATCSSGSTSARLVTVTVRYTISPATPMLGLVWGNPIQLTATTTARIFQ